MRSRPRIVEQHGTVLSRGDEFEPVDHQGIVGIAQRNLIHKAVGISDLLLADSSRAHDTCDLPITREVCNPFVKGRVRVGFAGQQKMGVLAQHPLAIGLVAVQVVAQVGDTP